MLLRILRSFSAILATATILIFYTQARDGDITTFPSNKNGSKESPYSISNASQLAYLSNMVSLGNSFSGNFFVLTNNINMNEQTLVPDDYFELKRGCNQINEWLPIGSLSNPFKGCFDGCGHTISGIYIDKTQNNAYVGLFGYATSSEIKNLTVDNSYIKGISYVGGICGLLCGKMENCVNKACVQGKRQVGGLCGSLTGEIIKCKNNGRVKGQISVGGLCGSITHGYAECCFNAYDVHGYSRVGGLFGKCSGCDIICCYNASNIHGFDLIGGLFGFGRIYAISSCFNYGKIFGEGDSLANCKLACKDEFASCYYLYGESKYKGAHKISYDQFANTNKESPNSLVYILNENAQDFMDKRNVWVPGKLYPALIT